MAQKGHFVVGTNRTAPASIYYELHGNGPEKVCLIMGLSTSIQGWSNQTEYLASTGKYTVLVFDNRGVGYSDSPWGLYSTSQMADDTIELLDHLGWKESINVVGISMGGMISLELADRIPERIASLTLTSTTARRNVPTWKLVNALTRIALFTPDPRDKVNIIVDLLYPPEWLASSPTNPKLSKYQTNREYATHSFIKHATKSRLQPLRGNVGQTAACLRHSVSDSRLKSIKERNVPTMVVTGTIDNFINPAHSHHLQKMLNAKLEIFEGSGHALPEEQSERYNALLEKFFDSTKNSKL
ncbi:Alpha/Beta hydrolase protein [Umbelopsis sp. AD052]|nr:Alpha/Beta hydrolase protein [Umbelopsis sp. AD052]